MGCGSLSKEEKIEILARTPLFLLPREELVQLAPYFKTRFYDSDQRIASENQPISELVVITQGEVEITISEQKKDDVFLCNKGKGDFFGDQALFHEDKAFRVNASASSPCLTLILDKNQFEKYCKTHPNMRERIQHVFGLGMSFNLEKIPFLQGLSEWDLGLLSALLIYDPVAANHAVFRQGDKADSMYIISSGSVRVTAVNQESKEEIEVAKVDKGRFFGEIALMVDMPRTASVTALEDCLFMKLRKIDFSNFLQVVPHLKERFDIIVKQRVAEHFKAFKVPFFASIPDDMYTDLAKLMEIEELDNDTYIFREGDMGDKFYIIVFGTVGVFVTEVKAEKTKQIHICDMGPGRFFGEVALLKDVTRTASIVTHGRCVLLSVTKSKFVSFFKSHPETYADFEIKLAKYDCTLEMVLRHPVGLKYFQQHLANEYSSENINFWTSVLSYRKLKEKEKLSEEGTRIIDTYVAEDAKEQVNLPARVRETLVQLAKQGDFAPTIFDDAQDEILKLMSKDSFSRFKLTNLFKDFMSEIDAYDYNGLQRGMSRDGTRASQLLGNQSSQSGRNSPALRPATSSSASSIVSTRSSIRINVD